MMKQKTDKISALLGVSGSRDEVNESSHSATAASASFTLAMENDDVEETLAAFGATTSRNTALTTTATTTEALLDDGFVDIDDIDVTYAANFSFGVHDDRQAGHARTKRNNSSPNDCPSSSLSIPLTSVASKLTTHIDAFTQHARTNVKRFLEPSSDWEICGFESHHARG